MAKFAKLFDVGADDQLLVKTDVAEGGVPMLSCITEINGTEAQLHIKIEPKEETEEGFEKAWNAAERYLEKFDQEKAARIYEVLTKEEKKCLSIK
jgi:altronate dehydratase